MERVMVFIDGSNFYHGLKDNVGKTRIDLQKFCNIVCGLDRRLVHIHYYNVPLNQKENPATYAEQQRFYNRLRLIPYFTLHFGRLVKREKHFKCANCVTENIYTIYTEKAVDVKIASHMLVYAFDNAYDTGILVSEDGDFVPVVEEIKRLNKRVENVYFPTDPMWGPSFLSQKCDKFIPLTKEYLFGCLY